MFEFEAPTDKRSIVAGLSTLGGEIGGYLGALTADSFFAPQGEAWSPDLHLRHLTRSIRPLAKALAWPRVVLGLRFWVSRGESRTFEQIVGVYQGALAAGGRAGGAYLPSRTPALDQVAAGQRQRLVLERWEIACGELVRVLDSWPEKALDRYRLPHPLIGKLTIREMLFFTLYHNAHHARRVKERNE